MPKTINIKGVIVSDDEKWIYDWFDIAATSPADVNAALEEADGEDVDVIVNSPGGSVYAGNEIYTALKSYKGRSFGKIVGLAASAASFAVLGCDTVAISPPGQIMVHNAWSRVAGDYRDMEHGAEFLRKTNTSIINVYRLKTGKTEDELRAMMDKETWMTAQEALEHGFVDEIMFDEQKQLAASASTSVLLPPEVVNKIRQLMAKEISQPTTPAQQLEQNEQLQGREQDRQEQEKKQLLAAKLKLIKMKGKVV